MLNGSRKTGNQFLIWWPVCKVRNRLSKSFINALCIYILIILINAFYCLRVSADTDAPAAITINSNLTAGVTRVDIKGTPPPCTLCGASITDTLGKCMPACQRDRPAVEV